MSSRLSRRRLLEAAGGITFLALAPNGRGAFAFAPDNAAAPAPANGSSGRLPVFTALPYLQPGGKGSVLVEGQESVVIAWQTDETPADFQVLVSGPGGKGAERAVAAPTRASRPSGGGGDGESRYVYAATLDGLKLGTRYGYRVRMNGKPLAEGYFTTRAPRGRKVRFATFGDNSFGEISDRMIAYQAYQARPDFVMNTGDNVYENGLVDEYERYFFPVYNADIAGERIGAPLLRSVPFYTVIANHDVHDKDKNKHPVADFTRNPGSLAYYTAMHLPLNGPEAPTTPTPTTGDDKWVSSFRTAAGDRFPRMANYSFDYGDGHFLCLDSNVYVDPTDVSLQAWIVKDLTGTDAAWKFVVYHHPAFNVGADHYAEQHMRVLAPLFEQHGVHIVLHGHEHNYQRTRPLRFAPTDTTAATKIGSGKRLVPGTFTIDRTFDGQARTVPNGVLYITTGAGGKHLYDISANADPAQWLHPEDGNADYTARFVSDRHSLTIVDMDAASLQLRQIDQWGNEIDRCRLTKA